MSWIRRHSSETGKMNLQENTAEVLQAIAVAAERQPQPHTVIPIAVTKYVDSSIAKELVETTAISHIGENRVEKFLEKYQALKECDVTWHLIGSLQRRKVKEVIDFVDFFHALDSVKLAAEIQKRASHPISCFLQVNISGEASKHGFTPDEVDEALKDLAAFDKVRLVGIMTMAPLEATEEELHAIFAETKALQEDLASRNMPNMPFTELSMGMSGDFAQAIAHGATFVRIGTAFFK